jgi:hypothetical protein
MAGLPYDDIQTNQEVMDAVDHGHRLELGQRLESDKHLAKLATMVEDSWDQRAIHPENDRTESLSFSSATR